MIISVGALVLMVALALFGLKLWVFAMTTEQSLDHRCNPQIACIYTQSDQQKVVEYMGKRYWASLATVLLAIMPAMVALDATPWSSSILDFLWLMLSLVVFYYIHRNHFAVNRECATIRNQANRRLQSTSNYGGHGS